MKSPTMALVLLVLIVLAAMWASGRLAGILNVVFGSTPA